MNLKDMAKQILSEGFDPKTDAVGGDFEDLPDGLYDGILLNALVGERTTKALNG